MKTRIDNKESSKESTVFIKVELNVEELEEVIAPKLAANHNETLVAEEIELSAEEMEEVIAPGVRLANHNETLVADEI